MSSDPFFGFATSPITLHQYLYALNNPARFVDRSGRSAGVDDLGFIVGGFIVGVAGAFAEGNPSKTLGDYVAAGAIGAVGAEIAGNCGELTAGLGSFACGAAANAGASLLQKALSGYSHPVEPVTPCQASASAVNSVVGAAVEDILGGALGKLAGPTAEMGLNLAAETSGCNANQK